MTFPLMPSARPSTFVKGALTYRSNTFGTVNLGNSSEDRWVIVVQATFSAGGIAVFPAPTVNGTSMTQLVQDYSTAGDDGHRGAMWALRTPSGTSATVTSTTAADTRAIFTLTGVRSPLTSYVASGNSSDTITNAVGACVIGYFIRNFNTISSVTNMTVLNGGSNPVIGYDLSMAANPQTYTPNVSVVLKNKLSWKFDY